MDVLVACLCAEWCGSCREYRAAFEALEARLGGRARFAWIDVEDESDALGDPDVENFPTLLVVRDASPLFLGPVTPAAAERIVQGAVDGEAMAAAGGDEAQALAARVRSLLAA